MFRSDAYDVIVVGGGPGGCAAASILARAGRSVLLLERETEFPFKLGESLMPETYFTFERMGALDSMKRSHFVAKHSVQFFAKSGQASSPFYFRDEKDHDSARTWQVLRSQFDRLLFGTARESGAETRRGVGVKRLLLEGDRAVGVQVRLQEGETREIGCRAVVDATGQSSFIARQLGLGKVGYDLEHASIFTHFRGAWRDQGIDEGATLILHTDEAASWFWYIPLADDVVSVGVVGGVDYLIKGRGAPEQTFWEEVERCTAVEERIAAGERCRPIQVIKDFSYRWERVAGEGWVLVGDAFSFIDPVYSSGVFLALKSGEMAADAILEAFTTGDFSAERLGAFQPRLMRGVDAVRRLVHAFYDRSFSFGTFLKQHPELRSGVTRILIGDVLDRDFDPLFAAMEAMRTSIAPSGPLAAPAS